MLKKQFFGKAFSYALVSFFAIYAVSIVASIVPAVTPVFLIGIIFSVSYIAWKDMRIALGIALGELIVGGHGHLLDMSIFGFSLSLRIAIFLAIIGTWFVLFALKKQSFHRFQQRDMSWMFLGAMLVLATLVGLMQNSWGDVIDDANSYFFILYALPVFTLHFHAAERRSILQILAAGAVFVSVMTLLSSYLFTHASGDFLHPIYTYLRDHRIAEITLQTAIDGQGNIQDKIGYTLFGDDRYWYRIFMQSQIFVYVFALFIFSMLGIMWRRQKQPILAILLFIISLSTLLLSGSRSFLLGAVMVLPIMTVFFLFTGKQPVITGLRRGIEIGISFAFSLLVVWATVTFPLPAQPQMNEALFYQTSSETGRDAAVSSRWALLQPAMQEIWSSPIIGSGFGALVTYTSDDPRIRAQFDGGVYTTYRFEWGYQDIWLKMGIFGLIAYMWIGYATLRALYDMYKKGSHKWIAVGCIGSVVMVFAVHTVSPYLNHPIGLGILLLAWAFIDHPNKQVNIDKQKEPAKKPELLLNPGFVQSTDL